MEEFSVSILYKIIFALSICGFTGLLIYFFIGNHPNAGLGFSLAEVSILIIMVLFLISRFVRKVIISADSIVSVRLFGQREILTSNVKGIRFTRNGVIIEAVSPANSRIVIYALDQLTNDEYLIKWLSENFVDLNATSRRPIE